MAFSALGARRRTMNATAARVANIVKALTDSLSASLPLPRRCPLFQIPTKKTPFANFEAALRRTNFNALLPRNGGKCASVVSRKTSSSVDGCFGCLWTRSFPPAEAATEAEAATKATTTTELEIRHYTQQKLLLNQLFMN